MRRPRRPAANPLAYLLACLVLAGAAVAVYYVARPSGPAAGPTQTGTTGTTSSAPARAFVFGRCAGGGCAPAAVKRYNLNVFDSDSVGCRSRGACGTPAVVAPDVYISRPQGLGDAPAPLPDRVLRLGPRRSELARGLRARSGRALRIRRDPPEHECAHICVYAHPAVDVAGGEPDGAGGIAPHLHDCGAAHSLICDDAPLVAGVIDALERCTTRTSSAGGAVGAWVAAGDPVPPYGQHPQALPGNGAPLASTSTARGVRRGRQQGRHRGARGRLRHAHERARRRRHRRQRARRLARPDRGDAPELPGAARHRASLRDRCVARPANTRISLQWIWGSADPAAVDPQYCAASNAAADCLGVGYAAGRHWAFGDIQLASTVIGERGLGCAPTPVGAASTGAAGRIRVTTYAHCTNPRVATQTVDVYGGQHLPDTWPTNQWPARGITCTSACRERNGSDGLVEPLAAWSFSDRIFPLSAGAAAQAAAATAATASRRISSA